MFQTKASGNDMQKIQKTHLLVPIPTSSIFTFHSLQIGSECLHKKRQVTGFISTVSPLGPGVDISSWEVAEAAVLHLCGRTHPDWL